MTTLLASLIGFFSSMFPDMLALYKNKNDQLHELKLAKLRVKQGELSADAVESKAIYRDIYKSGSKFIDALSASVRPVVSYGFFFLYAAIKVFMFIRIYQHSHDILGALSEIWTEQDWAIFAAIISFWFGYRSFREIRKKL